MNVFWISILVAFFVINSLEKAKSVKLEFKTFDEIFGEGWWDQGEAEDLKIPPANFGQNVHYQIDRQNTQIGQIEPNSIDQLGQIEPNSTDLNPSLTESDHSDNAKNAEEQKQMTSKEKRKIIDKFHEIKDEFKQKGKYSKTERNQIEEKIAKDLKVGRSKIYKWKKEFGLSRKVHNFGKEKEERKHLVEKFDKMKAELKQDGFKSSYKNEINETVAKELGLSFGTISNWKQKLGQTEPNHKYPHSEQKKLMKCYYEIKNENPKINDADIAKMLKIGRATLYKWKKQFHPNSVDGHSVEVNVQEIENSNSRNI